MVEKATVLAALPLLAQQIEHVLEQHPPNLETLNKMSRSLRRVQIVYDQIQIIRRKEVICKVFLSRDYRLLRFSDFDEFENNHSLSLRLDDDETTSDPLVTCVAHSLPDIIDGSTVFSATVGGTIDAAFHSFLSLLQRLQPFYDNMNTLDELCFIVGPANVTTKSVTRLLKIGDNIYLKIVVNPMLPSSIGTSIIGPTHAVGSFRSKYEARCRDWDISLDIHKNLLRIFEVPYFPMRFSGEDDEANEKLCGICLQYRSSERQQIPIVSCDNVKCEQVYHTECLTRWFATLFDSKTFLTRTMGLCPYCNEKLSTSFVSLLENDEG